MRACPERATKRLRNCSDPTHFRRTDASSSVPKLAEGASASAIPDMNILEQIFDKDDGGPMVKDSLQSPVLLGQIGFGTLHSEMSSNVRMAPSTEVLDR